MRAMEGISYELGHPEMSRPKSLWDRDGWGQGMVLTYTQGGDQEVCLISWGSRELPTLVSHPITPTMTAHLGIW